MWGVIDCSGYKDAYVWKCDDSTKKFFKLCDISHLSVILLFNNTGRMN